MPAIALAYARRRLIDGFSPLYLNKIAIINLQAAD